MLQPRLTKVEPMPQMKLQLFYETGEVKIFDVAPYATGPWYGQLQDAGYFNAVQMLPGGIGIEWPEGQDIAPHELYENTIARWTQKSMPDFITNNIDKSLYNLNITICIFWLLILNQLSELKSDI